MKDSVIDIFERQSSFNFRPPSHQVNEKFNIFCYDTKKVFYTSLFWKIKLLPRLPLTRPERDNDEDDEAERREGDYKITNFF